MGLLVEFLIRVQDKLFASHPSHRLAGSVIAAKPDGWSWGTEEKAHPDWRIVRVPGMTPIEAEALMMVDRDAITQATLKARRYRLSAPGAIAALHAVKRGEIAEFTRAQWLAMVG